MLRTRVRVQKRIREDAEDREAGPAGALASASTSSPGLTTTETVAHGSARLGLTAHMRVGWGSAALLHV